MYCLLVSHDLIPWTLDSFWDLNPRKLIYTNILITVCFTVNTLFQEKGQGCSARLVLPAILDKRRTLREICNLLMRFVILKVGNPFLYTVSRGPLYVIVGLPGSWDWPTWLNKPWSRSSIKVQNEWKLRLNLEKLLGSNKTWQCLCLPVFQWLVYH